MHKSSTVRQLHSKIALPNFIAGSASFLYVKFNALQLALISECRLHPIFKVEWHRNGLDVRMTPLR
jgi:hypothetical protein